MNFFGGSFFESGFYGSVGGSVEPGGSGRSYNSSNLDPDKWRGKRKKLKRKIELIQKQIDQQRQGLSLAPAIEATKQLMLLQKQLLQLLSMQDELNKRAEFDEVMAIYLAHRRLH